MTERARGAKDALGLAMATVITNEDSIERKHKTIHEGDFTARIKVERITVNSGLFIDITHIEGLGGIPAAETAAAE